MIRRPIIAVFILAAAFSFNLADAQQTASFKSFTAFKNVVPDIDFYASSRQTIAPYEKPAGETIAKLKQLFGPNLPKGAIFICSTQVQKDAVYEPKVLRSGYSWSLVAETPEVRAQAMLARIKSQMGGDVPAEIRDRMQRMQPEMMANAGRQVSSITQQIAHAVIQTLLDKDIQYRSSRLDDMSKSSLPDWLDIGIATYASGANNSLSYLSQNMDQTFPIEDVLSMARPFVASTSGQNGGGDRQGRSGGGNSGGNQGDFPGGDGMRGGGQGGFPGGGQAGALAEEA